MAAPYPQLLLLGDSILQRAAEVDGGYSMQAELQLRCIRRFDVVNRGLSGWTTKNVLEYMEELVPEREASSPEIKYLVLQLGANDACLEHMAQHVPIDKYKENLTKIITHARIQAHSPMILLTTPPPLDELQMGKFDKVYARKPNRLAAVTQQYAEMAREIAHENPGVILLDLEKAIMDKAISMTDGILPTDPRLGTFENGKSGGLDRLLVDGLHLNGEGYRVYFDLLQKHMGEEWESLANNDRTKYVFPDWSALNPPKN